MSAAGGGSAHLDEIASTTELVGRAFSAFTFPDIYKIQDFHSDDAPPLQKKSIPPLFAAIFGKGNIFERDDDDEESPNCVLCVSDGLAEGNSVSECLEDSSEGELAPRKYSKSRLFKIEKEFPSPKHEAMPQEGAWSVCLRLCV